MNEQVLVARINKLEKLVKENGSFREWSSNELNNLLSEIDDLMVEAITAADDAGNTKATRELDRALAIIRRINA